MIYFKNRECYDVFRLHEKFGFTRNETPTIPTQELLADRINMMQEELEEFDEARIASDLPGMADALIDLCYFVKGTAIILGLPWAELWADVHRANVSKVRGVGPRGMIEDCVKPPNWEGPHTVEILRRAGWRG